MAGAYVAKPAAVVPVDYPPGWDGEWPWPGPYPPGWVWDDIDTETEYPFQENDPEGRPDTSAGIIAYPWSLEVHEDDRESAGGYVGDNKLYVVLRGRPAGSVTVPISIVGDSGVTCSPSTLTFTQSNYNRPQEVSFHGYNDEAVNGDWEDIPIVVGPASSFADEDYDGLAGPGNLGGTPGTDFIKVDLLEEVNNATFWITNIAGTPAYHYDGPTLIEDFVEVHAQIYEVASGVSTIAATVNGTPAVTGYRRQSFSEGVTYSGSAVSGAGGDSFYIESGALSPFAKYVMVVKIVVGGGDGNTGPVTCGTRVLFYYDTVELEDYQSTTLYSADFGQTKYWGVTYLDNTVTTAAKLTKPDDVLAASYTCTFTMTITENEVLFLTDSYGHWGSGGSAITLGDGSYVDLQFPAITDGDNYAAASQTTYLTPLGVPPWYGAIVTSKDESIKEPEFATVTTVGEVSATITATLSPGVVYNFFTYTSAAELLVQGIRPSIGGVATFATSFTITILSGETVLHTTTTSLSCVAPAGAGRALADTKKYKWATFDVDSETFTEVNEPV